MWNKSGSGVDQVVLAGPRAAVVNNADGRPSNDDVRLRNIEASRAGRITLPRHGGWTP